MKTTIIALIAASLFMTPPLTRSQGTAVPFLLVPPSPESLGMGGGSISLPSGDAIATVVNPGQLGLSSLTNLFNASTYVPESDWLPQYQIAGMSYGVTALNAGYNLRSLLSLPFGLSVGLGYSRVSLDLGTFALTNSGGPSVIGTYESSEHSDNFSMGIGLDCYVRLGVGLNLKRIVSEIGPVGAESEKGTATGRSSATDFGILLDVPILQVVSKASGAGLEIAPGMIPFLDVSLGYVKANVGEEMRYLDPAQADPLPRTSEIGLCIGTGIAMKSGGTEWQLASFRLVRQVDDLLVTRNIDGSFDYKSGLGDIQFWDNVVLGKHTESVTLRRGWQVQVGEFFSWREGSVESPGRSPYTTSGYSICLAGVLRCVHGVSQSLIPNGSWLEFAMGHFDLQFHSAKYDQPTPAEGRATASSLNLVVRGFSL
jgi:hypothetical protein